MTGKSNSSLIVPICLYIVLLAGFFAASFFTELRLWGLSTWGYLPLWGRVLLLGIGFAFIPLALKIGNGNWTESRRRNAVAILTVLGASVLAGFCFWFLRGQTHFLGDGYGNIQGLSSKVPNINSRDLGEVMAHLSLARLLGGNTKENVLLSYQLISVTAGVLMLLAVAWTALRMYERLRDVILFSLAVLTTGQVLLFFGYVENYSLFIVAVSCFTCVGLLATRGQVARWTILIPLVISIFLHVLGVVLILPAVYLLLAGRKIERRIAELSRPAKVGLVLLSLAVVAVSLWFAMERSLFLRIALLTLTPTRFTVEGYTLFSFAHLVDFVNLMLILLPGLPLLLLGFWQIPAKKLFARTEYRFLLIMIITSFAAVFVFDPKLGMPRDWDLFSFAGVSMSILFAYALLDERNGLRFGRTVVALAIVLAALSGAARVATQVVPSMGLRQIEDYIGLDRIKCKGAMVLLQSFYAERHDRDRFARWGEEYCAFPEESLINQADTLIGQNRLTDALTKLRQAVRLNPMQAAPYPYISVIHLRMGRTGEARAVLDTALAISSGNPQALVGKGYFLQIDGNPEEAERLYVRATELAPEKSLAWFYLARLRRTVGDTAHYVEYLKTAAGKSDAAPEVHIELCDVYISEGKYREAAVILKGEMDKGMPLQLIRDLMMKYPRIQEYLRP